MNKKNRLLCLLSLTLTLSLSAQEIKLGTQTWAKANLNVSTFRNGDAIHEAKTATEWKQPENKENLLGVIMTTTLPTGKNIAVDLHLFLVGLATTDHFPALVKLVIGGVPHRAMLRLSTPGIATWTPTEAMCIGITAL